VRGSGTETSIQHVTFS